MTTVFIIFLLVAAALLILFSKSALVPWINNMSRINPGVVNKAEWMAPPHVIEAVKRDYLAFYHYATRTLPHGWIPYLRDLNTYLCDDMLREQRESLEKRLKHDRGRIFDILRANHQLEVRHFSADGATCLMIDHQTERRLATYHYWDGQRVHTQDIGSATLVYKMRYDSRSAKWKIASYIQTLPPGMTHGGALEIDLPHTIGRDY